MVSGNVYLMSRDKHGVSALTLSKKLDWSLTTTIAILRELRALLTRQDCLTNYPEQLK